MFLASLDRYQDTFVSEIQRDLETPDASLAEIQNYFAAFVEMCKTEQGKLGCFMCNTATELSLHDDRVAEKVNRHLQRLTKAFYRALTNARRQNEINPELDLDDYAQYLTGVVLGLCVYARSQTKPEIIASYVKVALSNLS